VAEWEQALGDSYRHLTRFSAHDGRASA
jgi:hypothetical protein